jgi:hypothetical protein
MRSNRKRGRKIRKRKAEDDNEDEKKVVLQKGKMRLRERRKGER